MVGLGLQEFKIVIFAPPCSMQEFGLVVKLTNNTSVTGSINEASIPNIQSEFHYGTKTVHSQNILTGGKVLNKLLFLHHFHNHSM